MRRFWQPWSDLSASPFNSVFRSLYVKVIGVTDWTNLIAVVEEPEAGLQERVIEFRVTPKQILWGATYPLDGVSYDWHNVQWRWGVAGGEQLIGICSRGHSLVICEGE